MNTLEHAPVTLTWCPECSRYCEDPAHRCKRRENAVSGAERSGRSGA